MTKTLGSTIECSRPEGEGCSHRGREHLVAAAQE